MCPLSKKVAHPETCCSRLSKPGDGQEGLNKTELYHLEKIHNNQGVGGVGIRRLLGLKGY